MVAGAGVNSRSATKRVRLTETLTTNRSGAGAEPANDDVPVRYAGLVTRAVALLLDAVAINAIAALAGGAINLIAQAFGHHGGLDITQVAISAALWVIWVVSYFVGFWTLTGQTPGDRVLGIRVLLTTGKTMSAPQSLLRVGATVLAALPLGAGFLPILVDERRRGLQDWIAHTIVIWVD